jgi:MFS family permease
MGIGGQYVAINSAIDEMMPSKYRGRVDIWINGSYWAGAILGSFASLIFLNAFPVNVGWRLAFLMGPVLSEAIAVFFAIACIFGALGPAFYGALIGDGSSRTGLVVGYVIGGLIMAAGGVIELVFGIKAEGQSLETVTKPLTATAS